MKTSELIVPTRMWLFC